jgi:predicted MPP superfamily phosphohydrolase
VRVLHISDLHASAGLASDQRILINGLLEDAKEQHRSKPFDLVVFTGDLAATGLAVEFELAEHALLRPLCAALDLAVERLVLVPGNHDIDRQDVKDFVERGLKEQLVDRDRVNALLAHGDDLALATTRLRNWRTFQHKFYEEEASTKDGTLAVVHRVTVADRSIGIAALNTAWRAFGGPEDQGHLLIGETQTWDSFESQPGRGGGRGRA